MGINLSYYLCHQEQHELYIQTDDHNQITFI